MGMQTKPLANWRLSFKRNLIFLSKHNQSKNNLQRSLKDKINFLFLIAPLLNSTVQCPGPSHSCCRAWIPFMLSPSTMKWKWSIDQFFIGPGGKFWDIHSFLFVIKLKVRIVSKKPVMKRERGYWTLCYLVSFRWHILKTRTSLSHLKPLEEFMKT